MSQGQTRPSALFSKREFRSTLMGSSFSTFPRSDGEHAMRLVLSLVIFLLLPFAAVGAENSSRETAIRSLLTKHKTWSMYWELTEAQLPGERAHRLTYEFFEREQKLMARLVFEYGGCEFEVPLRADGITLRYCAVQGEPSLAFDPDDQKYPFKQRDNPRKLWLTPKN